MNVLLYGPPAVGKSTVARELGARLGWSVVDVDDVVEAMSGQRVADLIRRQGEPAFRRLESEVCRAAADGDAQVVALGGGALLDRARCADLQRNGIVVCLDAPVEVLRARIESAPGSRPLTEGPDGTSALAALLGRRAAHYASFAERVETDGGDARATAACVADLLEPQLVSIRSPLLSHDVVVGYGLIERLQALRDERGLGGPAVIVTDTGVARCLGPKLPADVPQIVLRGGERGKSLRTIEWLSGRFAAAGLDRSGLVIAIGGGVVTDIAGFAAASYMRGVRWIAVPTSLVGMVDASIGGKTGVNLAAGKNLVGAFHPPQVVFVDPIALATLPAEERTSGMAEVIKHAVIGDAGLFAALEDRPVFGSVSQVRRAIGVKAETVESDPHEKGRRAVLNLGHTVGHAVETASGYLVRHGDAVAIGMVAEARIARRIGLCEEGLPERIEALARGIGLPTAWSGAPAAALRRAMDADKKNARGTPRFALPVRLGQVDYGIEVPEEVIEEALGRLVGDQS